MKEQSQINKKAWEYRAYEFWNAKHGAPEEKAKKILNDPLASLKKHQSYFKDIEGKRIANLCGSNGRKAVPLALLGAEVVVFDISEENKRYALELAQCAKTEVNYVVTDLYEIDLQQYGGYFDLLYLEGGILHYFSDIQLLMSILYRLLKDGGRLILSDFHPLRRCLLEDGEVNYFDTELKTGDVAYKQYFKENEQELFPAVSIRLYTVSEIINSVIGANFVLKKFDEHRGWNGENIPWEFTIIADK